MAITSREAADRLRWGIFPEPDSMNHPNWNLFQAWKGAQEAVANFQRRMLEAKGTNLFTEEGLRKQAEEISKEELGRITRLEAVIGPKKDQLESLRRGKEKPPLEPMAAVMHQLRVQEIRQHIIRMDPALRLNMLKEAEDVGDMEAIEAFASIPKVMRTGLFPSDKTWTRIAEVHDRLTADPEVLAQIREIEGPLAMASQAIQTARSEIMASVDTPADPDEAMRSRLQGLR